MLKVLKSGFYSTIQDLGRFGYRGYGIPVSGAMDLYSSQFANAVLGNSKDCATLEMTMTGPVLQFFEPTRIALSGAMMNPMLNSKPSAMNSLITVNTNDILSFGRLEKGFRCYMAISGGFLTEQIFKSRSMHSNITKTISLSVGDVLDYLPNSDHLQGLNATVKYNSDVLTNDFLEVYKGPEFEDLTKNQQDLLLNSDLKVSKHNNRMAYQLESLFLNSLNSILTAPVLPGTVQLTPSGRLIVLMRDCQTTGGYPRILQLTEQAINCLSQKGIVNSFKFKLKA